MMKKEELQAMKVSELMALCKANGIPHYHGKNHFRKDELVKAILGAGVVGDNEMENNKNETKIGVRDVEVEEKNEKESTNVDVDVKQKMSYIEGAVVGTIVAFRLPNGKVKSAKIIKRSTKRHQLMLETDYGAQYIASYEDVIWVRTGKRWPRGVYELLKGLVDADETEAN